MPLVPLRIPCATLQLLESFTANLLCRGCGAISNWQQVIVTRNVAVFWKVIRILAETSIAAECSLDNTHCWFCDKREHITHGVRNGKQKALCFILGCVTKYSLLFASM